ncbi:MAG: hypothetical protein QXF07_01545 [Candidatus Micrarchaeia archaeon]
MTLKKDWKDLNREIAKQKQKEGSDLFPIYKAICVEEHKDLREMVSLRLKEIGNSFRDFKIQFSILIYNNEIQGELIKNGETDLVILDLDQNPTDIVNIVSQIRTFGLYTPIIFASVERMKAYRALNLVTVTDLALADRKDAVNDNSYLLAMRKIDEYLISLENSKEIKSMDRILFPILNHLIYHAIDKQTLYLSKGPRLISSAIFRAKEIKKHVERILNEKDKKD